ncbi:hypothetical protein, partial [Pontimicrobium sp. MEBiC06410]
DHAEAPLQLALDYNTDIFTSETADRLLTSLVYILNTLAKSKTVSLQNYNILSPEEETKLLRGYNATKSNYNKEQLIHEQFEAQAKATPKATAVLFEDRSLSYDALD